MSLTPSDQLAPVGNLENGETECNNGVPNSSRLLSFIVGVVPVVGVGLSAGEFGSSTTDDCASTGAGLPKLVLDVELASMSVVSKMDVLSMLDCVVSNAIMSSINESSMVVCVSSIVAGAAPSVDIVESSRAAKSNCCFACRSSKDGDFEPYDLEYFKFSFFFSQ